MSASVASPLRISTVALSDLALPPLRQDLNLFEAHQDDNGVPVWHLHDPAANQFYRLSWPAFELLSRWWLGNAQSVVDAVNRETTLQADLEDVTDVFRFVEHHDLLDARTSRDSERMLGKLRARKRHWGRWLLENYLFFRIPLIRPEATLDRMVPAVAFLFHPLSWAVAAFLTASALVLLSRQWDAFVHSFTAYQNWSGWVALGIALGFAKIFHEIGHGLAARHHGCRVPVMGIAFLVLWPMLYTDTNESWKLRSRGGRFQIALAGMATETLIAILATWAWILLPDSSARAAAFFLATTTWMVTLAINASPFMRFDGYFLLSDATGISNLHSRSFALGRWWMRERLFDFGDPPAEEFSPRRSRWLIAFAFATWLYRFALFLGIALLVYHFFFKALGVALMVVEVSWFIGLPVIRELKVWWRRRNELRWTLRTGINAALVAIMLGAFFLPWYSRIQAPAVLSAAPEQNIYPPAHAVVMSESTFAGQVVKRGDILLRLESPDLASKLKIAGQEEANLRRQLEQQHFAGALLRQGSALRSYWELAAERLDGLKRDIAKLEIRAPFDGAVLARSDEIVPGLSVTPRDLLYVVADRRRAKLEAYLRESDIERVSVGARGMFFPDAPGFSHVECVVTDIDQVTAMELEEPLLASIHGGPIPAKLERNGVITSVNPELRVRFNNCMGSGAPPYRLRGVVHIEAERRGFASMIASHVLRTLAREGGL